MQTLGQTLGLTLHRQVVPALAVVVLGFLVLVALPFFLYGLHLQSDAVVLGGGFDPKDRLPFTIRPIYYLAAYMAALGPFAAAALTVTVPAALVLARRALVDRRSWVMGLAAWSAGAATLLLLLSPVGHNITGWFLD